jgi:O-antigen/teichoic acid export membrane protein
MLTKLIELFNSNKTFFKGLSLNLFYRIIVVIATLISGILITRSILEEGRGIYNLFITSLTMVNLFMNLGFNSSAITVANQHPEKLNRFFSFNILLSIVSAFILSISLIILPNIIPLKSISIIFLFIFTYLMYSINLTVRSMLIGKDLILFSGRIDMILKLILLVVVIILFLNNKLNIFVSILIILIEYLSYTIIGFFKLKIKEFSFKIDIDFLKYLFNFNVKSYLFGFLYFVLLRGDQYIVKYFLGNYYTGIYSQSGVITEQLQIITAVAATMVIPKFLNEKNFKIVIQKTNKLLFFVFCINLFIAICFYLIAPYVIELYFKNKNSISVETFRIMLVGFLPWSLYVILNVMMHSVRYKKSNILILLIITSLNIMFNYVLGPKFGIKMIAWISVISYFILFFLSYIDMFYLKRKNFNKRIQKENWASLNNFSTTNNKDC